MKPKHSKQGAGRRRTPIRIAGLAILVAMLSAGLAATALAAATAVGLGTAGSFAILAGSGITNTGVTTVNGDVGSYPTTSETGVGACPGAPGCFALTGTNDAGNGVTQGAKNDLTTAYNQTAAEGPRATISTIGAGQTLTAGVYNSASSIQLNGALTLDGGNNLKSVFVFQAGSTLTAATSSTVLLVNGAQACNVFWQVGSSATLKTSATFQGTILAFDDISLGDDVTVAGRLLAGEQASGAGAVTLIHDTISSPTCASGTTTTTTAGGGTTTTVAGGSTTTTVAGGGTTTTVAGGGGTTTTVPVHHGSGNHSTGTATSTGKTTGVSKTPKGSPQTGGGSTGGMQHSGLFGLGGALLLGGAGTLVYRRRRLLR